ncbi:MAG: hypothetical protein HFE54_02495 [Turicibacter sp.]|jgi:hypothetical protein|uniref:DUF4177 domain-containing protein n=1 Tax=Turicibacter faecis TaxID=2963365 RepID=A0ABN6ZHB2_9FIRM|nr:MULTISPECIES: hypothetical protein [unclassified Turicibacter]MCI8701300.1 hypothetical protein [Turicibacter sp.]BEH90762.1 hypothetical protein T23_08640 [Turicibacter sp. TC023]MCI9350791.1 hypothetical protein [Turicibacter sp.]MCU7204541.1 hypothetical protein [Turicibacter sp. TA25]MCU7208923.1 hypothetical protein [Turicibacter sp. 1E2]
MKKFEYRLENLAIDIKTVLNVANQELTETLKQKLDELGQEGWRLCGVNGHLYYFTREL